MTAVVDASRCYFGKFFFLNENFSATTQSFVYRLSAKSRISKEAQKIYIFLYPHRHFFTITKGGKKKVLFFSRSD